VESGKKNIAAGGKRGAREGPVLKTRYWVGMSKKRGKSSLAATRISKTARVRGNYPSAGNITI